MLDDALEHDANTKTDRNNKKKKFLLRNLQCLQIKYLRLINLWNELLIGAGTVEFTPISQ